MSVGLLALSHYNLQYDAGGTEGSIWWTVFLLAVPYNIAREYIVEIIPNSSHSIVALLSYVAASLIIVVFYLLLNRISKWWQNTTTKSLD